MNPGTHALNWCGMSLWKEKYGLRDQVGLTLSLSDRPWDTYIPVVLRNALQTPAERSPLLTLAAPQALSQGQSVTVPLRPGRNRHDGHLLAARHHE